MEAGVNTRWQVDCETGVLTDVLLCRPDYYDYIPSNAIVLKTMGAGGRADRQKVVGQYRELEDALEGAGVRLHYLTPEPHLPYQVYTRDSSQVTPWGPLITQLYRKERRGEYASVTKFYAGTGGLPWGWSTTGTLEGGDIHIIRPGLVAVGVSGIRTDEAGARQFLSLFEEEGWKVLPVFFDEHFLHLDVIFSMVADGLALVCPDAVGEEFLAWLAANGIRILPVTYAEAMRDMACNVLALGNGRVISPKHSVRVNDMLRAEGLEVITPALDVFSSGGGSVHCMTMPLKRQGV
ncbi:dimethylarginine dimethylaminohydrolase family protein [Radicibacter daui]|uniref:dimethylarginine dimethylaminohydrolase family protein n=1 Tax=Radicibacter daui TaxID=3064829 RepID=UPI004046A4C0